MDMFSFLLGRSSGGGGKGSLKVVVVEELPETGEANILYLVPRQVSKYRNVFDEYLYVDNDWEMVGTTDIDISGKQDKMQFATMPTANADNLGKIYQYIGTTNANYTNGYFYICLSDGEATPTYSWENINVQGSSSGGIYNFTTRLYYSDWRNWSSQDTTNIIEMTNKALNGEVSIGGFQETTSNGFAWYLIPVHAKGDENKVIFAWVNPYNGVNATVAGFGARLFYGGFTITLNASKDAISSVANFNTLDECLLTKSSFAPLAKTNTNAYYPTNTYHPSTKEYSDLAPLLNANNISYFQQYTNYSVDDVVYYGGIPYSSTDKYYKCIKNTTGTQAPTNTSYWQEITLSAKELKVANQKYVDDSIASAITTTLGGNY